MTQESTQETGHKPSGPENRPDPSQHPGPTGPGAMGDTAEAAAGCARGDAGQATGGPAMAGPQGPPASGPAWTPPHGGGHPGAAGPGPMSPPHQATGGPYPYAATGPQGPYMTGPSWAPPYGGPQPGAAGPGPTPPPHQTPGGPYPYAATGPQGPYMTGAPWAPPHGGPHPGGYYPYAGAGPAWAPPHGGPRPGAAGPGHRKHDAHQYGQFMGLVNDIANGNADASRMMAFLDGLDNQFWKGALIGVAATLLLTNDALKNGIAGSLAGVFGAFDKSSQDPQTEGTEGS